jgi:hypothetical protein|tara:strand:+ start:116 stop:370 length:255 start_codon:yes stop_codon:yes gene_type:complete
MNRPLPAIVKYNLQDQLKLKLNDFLIATKDNKNILHNHYNINEDFIDGYKAAIRHLGKAVPDWEDFKINNNENPRVFPESKEGE